MEGLFQEIMTPFESRALIGGLYEIGIEKYGSKEWMR